MPLDDELGVLLRDRVLNEVTWNHVFVRYDYGYGLWLLRMDRID